jgi:hypothetical protein
LNNKIKNYKNFDKIAKETNKKSKEEGPNWNKYSYYWKKNHKSNLNSKIKNYKNFDKRAKEKNKKSKVANQKTSYTLIRIE